MTFSQDFAVFLRLAHVRLQCPKSLLRAALQTRPLHGGDPHPGPTTHRWFSKELILFGAARPIYNPFGPVELLALAETWDQSHGWQCPGQEGNWLALGDVC